MKTKASVLWVTAGVVSLLQFPLLAAEPVAATVEAPVVVQPAPAPAVRLPYGVEDVLKLSKAQISETIITTYVHNSGTTYNLQPRDILYLRDQGVSDAVVTAMLDTQRKAIQSNQAMAAAQAAQAPAPAPAPQYAPAPAQPVTYVQQPSTTYVQPAPTYVEPASSVYVIPYPAARYAYYGNPYGYYGGYGYPSVAFSFGYYGGGGNCYYKNNCNYNYNNYCGNNGYYVNGFYNGYKGSYNNGYKSVNSGYKGGGNFSSGMRYTGGARYAGSMRRR